MRGWGCSGAMLAGIVGFALWMAPSATAQEGAISGVITTKGSIPVSGAPIETSALDGEFTRYYDTVTGSDGRYVLQGLPPGSYTLSIGEGRPSNLAGCLGNPGCTTFQVTNGETTNGDVQLDCYCFLALENFPKLKKLQAFALGHKLEGIFFDVGFKVLVDSNGRPDPDASKPGSASGFTTDTDSLTFAPEQAKVTSPCKRGPPATQVVSISASELATATGNSCKSRTVEQLDFNVVRPSFAPELDLLGARAASFARVPTSKVGSVTSISVRSLQGRTKATINYNATAVGAVKTIRLRDPKVKGKTRVKVAFAK